MKKTKHDKNKHVFPTHDCKNIFPGMTHLIIIITLFLHINIVSSYVWIIISSNSA